MLQSGWRVGRAEVMSEADVGGAVNHSMFQCCKGVMAMEGGGCGGGRHKGDRAGGSGWVLGAFSWYGIWDFGAC